MTTMEIKFLEALQEYYNYRKLCGMKESSTFNITYFYRRSCKIFPGVKNLTQAMIDEWWKKNETENQLSYTNRLYQVLPLLRFIQQRHPETEYVIRKIPKWKFSQYIPHSFTEEELSRFFNVCDHRKLPANSIQCKLNFLEDPIIYRLLFSTGMRTTEVRLLKRDDVNLSKGTIYIRRDATKGYRERIIVLHETMIQAMRVYDAAMEKLMPSRNVFFPNQDDAPHGPQWLTWRFKLIWSQAGNENGVVPYDLRHHFIITNINSWTDKGYGIHDDLVTLSKYVGHSKVQKTYSYYAYVPRLGDEIERRSNSGLDCSIPTINFTPDEEYNQ